MKRLEEQNYIRELGYEEMNISELKSLYVRKAKSLNSYLKKNFPAEKFNGIKPAKLADINNIPNTRKGLISKIYEVDRRIDAARFAAANIGIILDFINNLYENYRSYMKLRRK